MNNDNTVPPVTATTGGTPNPLEALLARLKASKGRNKRTKGAFGRPNLDQKRASFFKAKKLAKRKAKLEKESQEKAA